jgi:hypothetical protein
MQIKPNEIIYKKKIGVWKKHPVIEVATKGGLTIVFGTNGGKFEPLGLGSHRALARHLASKKTDNELEITELEKSEQFDVEHYREYIPYYEALTNSVRKKMGF